MYARLPRFFLSLFDVLLVWYIISIAEQTSWSENDIKSCDIQMLSFTLMFREFFFLNSIESAAKTVTVFIPWLICCYSICFWLFERWMDECLLRGAYLPYRKCILCRIHWISTQNKATLSPLVEFFSELNSIIILTWRLYRVSLDNRDSTNDMPLMYPLQSIETLRFSFHAIFIKCV